MVEVDADTGFVKILRWLSSEDCGTVINPAVVEGQIAGGLAQAIGMVLLEEVRFDDRGNPLAATYKDYRLPAISDIPDFEFVHAGTPSQSVGGMRGCGEGGAIIGAPTLVNAIADALVPFGEVPVDLPLTPTKLLSVIEGRDLTTKTVSDQHHFVADHAATAAVPEAEGAGLAPPAAEVGAPAEILIDGDWKMVLASPVGPQEMTAHFETDGENLSGYLSSPEGRTDFTGTVAGGDLKFEVKVVKPVKITLKYNLAVTGDRIAGKCKMGIFGSAKVTGQRS